MAKTMFQKKKLLTYKKFYLVREDENNISIYRDDNKKQTHIGYYSKFGSALYALIEYCVGKCDDLEKIQKEMKEFKEMITTIKEPEGEVIVTKTEDEE